MFSHHLYYSWLKFQELFYIRFFLLNEPHLDVFIRLNYVQELGMMAYIGYPTAQDWGRWITVNSRPA